MEKPLGFNFTQNHNSFGNSQNIVRTLVKNNDVPSQAQRSGNPRSK